ncbi:TIGR02679 family protein [Pseudonocardia sp. NPDC046786]|uniref:TIGR02679 family protein n=1 Tax=Pseudonocardia sp. NPDC046786 TaxID=3155471 RepID=UPI0033EA7EA6
MSPDPGGSARLQRLLGGPETAWLRERVRRRLERGEPLTGAVTRNPATDAEQDAVAGLLGRRRRSAGSVSVRLAELDDVLRRSGVHSGGLAGAVVDLTGPVIDREDAVRRRAEAWRAAFAPLDETVRARPELTVWRDHLVRTGLVRRLAPQVDEATGLLTELAAVLVELPAEPQPIGRFAERVLGSAHALDQGRPLTALVLRAAAALGGVGEGRGAAWDRAVWASVGLVRDELSATVLTLNLPGDTDTRTGRMLTAMAGEPAVLTLRQLVRQPARWELDGTVVSICENPVVVAEAAERLGDGCGPLVCTAGQPSAAVMAVLRGLAAAGGALRHHGDFDWGGVRIANLLVAALPVVPWRYDTLSYLRWVGRSSSGAPLRGTPVEAAWDPALAAEMRRIGRSVEEERVVDELLSDLRPG